MGRRRLVVLGLLGTTLERAQGPRRWEVWRPTVSLCQHDDLIVDRLELLHDPAYATLASAVADDIRHVSPETKVDLHRVAVKDPWDFEEVYGALHDFARGYSFDPDHEDYLVHITTGTHVAQICLFLLTEARYFPARLVQTGPPPKGAAQAEATYTVIDLDLSRYDRLAARFRREELDQVSLLKSGIATGNAAFNELIDRLERVAARSTAPILLMGPTGAGKSLLARRIYELRRARRLVAGPFVEVNCATLRGEGAMSALFGHVKGAFTGAVRDRPGLLRQAHGGLLFLDEVGELGEGEQTMLLRAVEERRFLPLGADEEACSDFQLITGTNRDLPADVRQGRFREDLLARINLWTFRLPALRERPEDVEPNVNYELDQLTRAGGTVVTFSKEARQRFLAFATSARASWPGNFRDLNGAIVRMATLAPGARITETIVADEIERLTREWSPGTELAGADVLGEVLGHRRAAALDLFDAVQLAEVVRVCRSARSLSDAGRVLFAESRKTKKSANDADRLRKYLARFDLTWVEIGGPQLSH
jgi:transcriptional regulatory protein RtcR